MALSTLDAVTPHRQTEIQLDPPEWNIVLPPWSEYRSSDSIVPQSNEGKKNITQITNGGPWTLMPLDKSSDRSGIYTASQMQLVKGTRTREMGSVPPDSGSAAPDASYATTTPYMVRTIKSSNAEAGEDETTDWNEELSNDCDPSNGGLPKPPSDREGTDTLLRVAVARKQHPRDASIEFSFFCSGTELDDDAHICNFYFGGRTAMVSVDPNNPQMIYGGTMCYSFYGDGTATLWEYVTTRSSGEWRTVGAPRSTVWANKGAVYNRRHHMRITPYPTMSSSDPGIAFTSTGLRTPSKVTSSNPHITSMSTPPAWRSGESKTMAIASPGRISNGKPIEGIPPTVKFQGIKRNPYGAGHCRVDVNANMRIPYQVAETRYGRGADSKPVGWLVDSPFVIPLFLPAGRVIQLALYTYTPKDTSIEPQILRTDNHQVIGKTSGTIPDGCSSFFVRFKFTGTGNTSPILYGYEVSVNGVIQQSTAPPVTVSQVASIKRVNITGPDIDPGHESASVTIEDPRGQLTVLRNRGRVRTRIWTSYDKTDPNKKVILFDGEIGKAIARKKGKGESTATSLWRQIECNLTGMWSRLSDQQAFVRKNFLTDYDYQAGKVRTDPKTGKPVPWKITDIVRWLFQEAGVHPSQLDIPDLGARAWATGGDSSEYLLQPATNILEYIQKLVKDYLGAYVIWEPNAGANGMWRLILPAHAGESKYTFYAGAPPGYNSTPLGSRKPVHMSYPPGSTFIKDFASYVKPPEANYVMYTAVGYTIPIDGTPLKNTKFCWNPNSFKFTSSQPDPDPSNPDYLGRFVPIIMVDPSLGQGVSEATLNLLCYRLFLQTCFAQKWLEFHAPLVFVDDRVGSGPVFKRPLRTYDTITVVIDGHALTCLVKNVNPDYDNDRKQFAHYEVMVAPTRRIALW